MTSKKEEKAWDAHVNKEVVLCGGAINSPQLLMLSGIGPAEDLTELGIPVFKSLPGVGQNLMDHVQVPVAYRCTQEISLVAKNNPIEVAKYREKRLGLLTSNLGEAGGFVKMGNDPMAVVDERLQVHGIQGLRVADASIMPWIVNANTNAPCIMIGEKAADMMLKESGS